MQPDFILISLSKNSTDIMVSFKGLSDNNLYKSKVPYKSKQDAYMAQQIAISSASYELWVSSQLPDAVWLN